MNWDLIVVGGGPAGSAAAITASKHRCRVLVLEGDSFPRPHVGESLVYLWPTLESLGVADEMDAVFQHKMGGTRLWGADATPRFAGFDHLAGHRKYSLQVERSLFDHMLLRRAEAVGSTVRQENKVLALLWDGDRAVGVRYATPDGEEHEAHAPFILDASGRRALVARHLGLHRVDSFYPDLAVYGYFEGAERLPGDHEGDVVIEAVPAGWLWFIPLHTGQVSVGLVSDHSSRPAVREQGLDRFFHGIVQGSTMVGDLLRNASIATPVVATASYGYTSSRYAGPGWMLAGDAAFFMDPMWATGVGNALSNGVLAGAAAAAVRDGRVPEENAVRYYDRELSGVVASIDATIKFVYGCNRLHGDSPFWAKRHRYVEENPPAPDKITTVFGPSIPRLIAQLTGTVQAPSNQCP